MFRVPDEVIYRHAFREAANYFAGKIEQKRKAGLVAVLVEDFWDSVYFMPCNKNGYPNAYNLETVELPQLKASWFEKTDFTADVTQTFTRRTIQIEKPLLMQRYDYDDYPIVFMWSGRLVNTDLLPMEKLNVQELMRAAQMAIQNREGLVIDEALKNKIYK